MSEITAKGTAKSAASAGRPSALAYCVYCEALKLLRIPMFVVPTFLFPILFFAMFGLSHVDDRLDGINAGRYMMASYGTYAVMAVALFSFGTSVSAERGMRWNVLLRTTPLRPLTYFVAKVAVAGIFGVAVLVIFFAFGTVVGGVGMPVLAWAELVGLLILGMLPFVALGLCIGYVAGPNSAAAVANLIFLPLSFASGLFLPLRFLPQVVQDIAPYLPSYHAAQLGWVSLGAGDGEPMWVHLLWLVGYAALFLGMAVIAYRRDEGKTFG